MSLRHDVSYAILRMKAVDKEIVVQQQQKKNLSFRFHVLRSTVVVRMVENVLWLLLLLSSFLCIYATVVNLVLFALDFV